MAEPQRGEVWLADLGYAATIRPDLELSVAPLEDERALYTLVTHTTQPRGTRFECSPEVRGLRVGVFDARSLVSVQKPRLIQRLAVLTPEALAAVEKRVLEWLGFSGR